MPAKTPVVGIQKFSTIRMRELPGTRNAFYFRLVAANGEIVAQSESYTTARARNATVKLLLRATLVEAV